MAGESHRACEWFHVVVLGWTLLSSFVSGLPIFNWLNSALAKAVSFIIAVSKNIAVGPGRHSLLDQLLIRDDGLETVNSGVLWRPEKKLDTIKICLT